MKNIQVYLRHTWQPLLWAIIGIGVILFLLLFHLGSEPSGLSTVELNTIRSSLSLRHLLLHNPINLPYYGLEHLFLQLVHKNVMTVRLISVAYGLVASIIFYLLLRFFGTNQLAVVATILFSSSSWFLHIARTNSPDVLFFASMAPLLIGIWYRHSHHRTIVYYVGLIVAVSLLYIPGMIWLLLLGLIWQRNYIIAEFHRISLVHKIVGLIICLLFLVPLGWSSISHPSILVIALGFPKQFISARDMWQNFIHIPLDLFVRSSLSPEQWLARLPLFDFFEDAMLLLGIYSIWYFRKLDKNRALIVTVLVSVLLITFGGIDTITLLVPLAYIIISRGIGLMLKQWSDVFPINPFVKYVGVCVLTVAVLVSASYQLDNYFTAWQNAPATRVLFTHSAEDI
jgi:hypothetical protein